MIFAARVRFREVFVYEGESLSSYASGNSFYNECGLPPMQARAWESMQDTCWP